MSTIIMDDMNLLLSSIKISKKEKQTCIFEKTQAWKHDDKLNIDDKPNLICTGCNSDDLNEIDGYNVCQNCGLYNECVIDSGQEWRYYGADDNKSVDPSRCDLPVNDLLPHTCVGSIIGYGTKETNTTKRIRNMNYWNSVPYRESSLLETFNNISIMAQNAGIPNCIIEEAKVMFKKVSDIKSSRRTKKEAMKAGCIMLSCKLNGVPRSCTEIAKIFKLKNNKTLRKSVKTFEEIWNNIQKNEKSNSHIDINDSESDLSDSDSDEEDNEDNQKNTNTDTKYESIMYLHRFCSTLGLDDKLYNIIKKILIIVEEFKYLERHNPLSRTASVLYYVIDNLKIKIDKNNIVQTCNISDVTITKCYQKLIKYKDQFIYLLVQYHN